MVPYDEVTASSQPPVSNGGNRSVPRRSYSFPRFQRREQVFLRKTRNTRFIVGSVVFLKTSTLEYISKVPNTFPKDPRSTDHGVILGFVLGRKKHFRFPTTIHEYHQHSIHFDVGIYDGATIVAHPPTDDAEYWVVVSFVIKSGGQSKFNANGTVASEPSLLTLYMPPSAIEARAPPLQVKTPSPSRKSDNHILDLSARNVGFVERRFRSESGEL
jgi:hypothetical protein